MSSMISETSMCYSVIKENNGIMACGRRWNSLGEFDGSCSLSRQQSQRRGRVALADDAQVANIMYGRSPVASLPRSTGSLPTSTWG